ncbi:MAG: glycosyltransferase [Mucilaginibacter sp.]|uniref:glycosyltransferase family 2 protein n=1 Tax=Mucilaginibacter sp. TaxID=1882438 RepID=UPI003266DB8D
MEKVSVVIPVYGQWNLLKRNIDALLKYDRDFISEIIVVNDCSPDQNPYEFDDEIVNIITNDTNKGYAGTVNNGLRKAKSSIIVLLDSDAYPLGKFIEKLLTMYKANPAIGCIGFGTVDDYGNDTGNFQYEPSILGLIAGQQLEAKFGFFRFWRNKNILPYSCAVSFTKDCLAGIDYLDEKRFPVLEADNDISMRVHRSKWKLLFTREIIICHKGGNSYKINYKRVVLFHESRWKLLRKHGLIWPVFLAKFLLQLRINMELVIFKILKNKNDRYLDKLEGRKIITKSIKHYP